MSEYGPALFVSRRDGAELTGDERAAVLRLVRSACRVLGLADDTGDTADRHPGAWPPFGAVPCGRR
ncbi:hypothetical protein GCM10010517_12810 [Streptosporangium fragile]|uniref:Acyl-CoA carboxylase subunit epsilon n=1 Tax=Streptosporangium fragile TaxID=46186 RepID=A0ABN3VT55_9ACTN